MCNLLRKKSQTMSKLSLLHAFLSSLSLPMAIPDMVTPLSLPTVYRSTTGPSPIAPITTQLRSSGYTAPQPIYTSNPPTNRVGTPGNNMMGGMPSQYSGYGNTPRFGSNMNPMAPSNPMVSIPPNMGGPPPIPPRSMGAGYVGQYGGGVPGGQSMGQQLFG